MGTALGCRPRAQPVRAAVGADADWSKVSAPSPAPECGVMSGQHERGSVPAGRSGPDVPHGLTLAAVPVPVTTARRPCSRPMVSQTRR
jgi:hypothetical protein